MRSLTKKAASLVLLAGLAGCGPNYSPNTYSSAAVQQANKVERGVIIGVRQVGVSADSTVGTVTGGAAGGIVGAQAGPGGAVTALGTLGGTVIGGLIGNSVEHATGDTSAYEYIVRQADGTLVSVTQKNKVPLEIGQTVLVIAGKQARIVPDYTVSVPNELAAPPSKAKAKPAGNATPAQAAASAAGTVGATSSTIQAAPLAAPAAAGAAGPAGPNATAAAPSPATPATPPSPTTAPPTGTSAGSSAAAAQSTAADGSNPPPLPPPLASSSTPQPNTPVSLALPSSGAGQAPADAPAQDTGSAPAASKP